MARNQKSVRNGEKGKKYPIRCLECGAKEVRPATVDHRAQRNHDGRLYDLVIPHLPVTRCSACGNVFFTQESDGRILAALREHLALLTPSQVRQNLKALRLTQKGASERLGVAPETMTRWLSGAMIQSRAMDNLMRVFFACPDARSLLQGRRRKPPFGTAIRRGPARSMTSRR